MQTTIRVNGMTCGHCERAVEGAISELDGVMSVSADRENSTVAIESERPMDASVLAALVAEEGFEFGGIAKA